MLKENNIKNCVGCFGCLNICQSNAIKMYETNDGFYYPKVDKDRCVECNLCNEVCPIEAFEMNDVSNDIYYFINEEQVRLESTSGGFFTALSDLFLKKNGSCYGSVFDENFFIKHERALSVLERNNQRGSKYVQSYIGDILKKVKEDLENKKDVIFSGTPCQISGLNNYLKVLNVDTTKLITCDFICHGVGSPLIWKDYLKFVSLKYSAPIKSIKFRDKKKGWHTPRLTISMFNNKIQSLSEAQDAYYQMYYSNCIMRESCYKCQFSSKKRVADITMGDCWGIHKLYPMIDDNKGISLVIFNSLKGKKYKEKFKSTKKFKKISYKDINQPHLISPVKRSRKRDLFWKEYKSKKYNFILLKYANYGFKGKIIKKIKKIILKLLGR